MAAVTKGFLIVSFIVILYNAILTAMTTAKAAKDDDNIYKAMIANSVLTYIVLVIGGAYFYFKVWKSDFDIFA